MKININKWIVITTINKPQVAIHAISKMCEAEGWRCIVVGDKKTPADWESNYIDYLSIDDQVRLYPELAKLLPYNHYCRKNIGYLYAIDNGAEVILETDDDNIPKDNFGKLLDRVVQGRLVGGADWINVYKYFNDDLIWPRGNPLDSIHESGIVLDKQYVSDCSIQQFLADGDPDVDAIYRLLYKSEVNFQDNPPVLLDKGSWCAFNSQNTLFYKESFPMLYLPCHVSFRMTDIWRSFVAQAVLWSKGENISFHLPTVTQVRNQHSLIKDFEDEIDGYLNNRKICELLVETSKNWSNQLSTKQRVFDGWVTLKNGGFINDEEICILKEWMKCLNE